MHSAHAWSAPFPLVSFTSSWPFPSEYCNDKSHLVILCSSHLLYLAALRSLRRLDCPKLFSVKFNDILILIRQSPTILPELVEQMAIKSQMTFWIPFDIESTLAIQRAFTFKMTFSSQSTISISAGGRPLPIPPPDSAMHHIKLAQKIF